MKSAGVDSACAEWIYAGISVQQSEVTRCRGVMIWYRYRSLRG